MHAEHNLPDIAVPPAAASPDVRGDNHFDHAPPAAVAHGSPPLAAQEGAEHADNGAVPGVLVRQNGCVPAVATLRTALHVLSSISTAHCSEACL